jgi:molecular chaperone DnaK
MVQEAEVNAESDKKTRELIEARNQAEAQIHSIKKDMEEVDAELSAEVKDKVNEAITSVDAAIITEDKDAITQKLSDLFAAAQPVMEAKQKKEEAKKNETAVDAEFTEVN